MIEIVLALLVLVEICVSEVEMAFRFTLLSLLLLLFWLLLMLPTTLLTVLRTDMTVQRNIICTRSWLVE